MSEFYITKEEAEKNLDIYLISYKETIREGIYNDAWMLCLRGEKIYDAWDIYSTFYAGKSFNLINLYIAEFNEFVRGYADCDDYLWNSRQWRGATNVRR